MDDLADYDSSDNADELCEDIAQPVTLNADIGGIGVYASYWIQSGLALLGTFLVLLLGWGSHNVYDPIMIGRRGTNAKKPAKLTSVSFKDRRLAHLTVALTDFQKAQCFFMLAINVAALVNKVNGGLTPVSLQQLHDNYSLLASVAVSGYLPITTTLLALHMVHMMSSYLLALSGCTVALSIATVAAIGNFNPSLGDLESIQAQASKGATYSQCGGFDLTVYCLRYQNDDLGNTYVWGILAYCLIVLFYMLAYHLNAFRHPSTNRIRPWVLCMASCMSILRVLQFTLTILVLSFELFFELSVERIIEHPNSLEPSIEDSLQRSFKLSFEVPLRRSFALSFFPVWDIILASLTLIYLAFVLLCRLRYFERIKSAILISIKCSCELLALMTWLVDFVFVMRPISAFIWVTFVISTAQLLRKAYVEDTKIRKWILKYRHFAYRDETLPTISSGNRGIGTRIREASTRIMKASITLTALLSMLVDKMEKRAASHDRPRKFRRFLVICLYWMIFSGCIISFVFFFRSLASFHAQVDTHTWSFGQIVAITVWAPPLCEYLHLELRGMTRGFQHRLLPPYKIMAAANPPAAAQPAP